jgi:cytochrome P450
MNAMTITFNKQVRKSAFPLPPGPTTPPWWNLLQWLIRPCQFLEECRARYGDTFTFKASGFETSVFISNPEDIREIFTEKQEHFDSGKANDLTGFLLGNYSIALLDGSSHKRQRKLLMPPFHSQNIFNYGKMICDLTEQVTSNWQTGQRLIIYRVAEEITLRVILAALLGSDERERHQQLKLMIHLLKSTIANPFASSSLFFSAFRKDWGSWNPWGNLLLYQRQIIDIIYAEIRERRQNPDNYSNDILSLMMAARDEAGEKMTDEELKDEIITLIFSGHETTAAAIAWACYWIHHLPKVRVKLLQELNELGNNPKPTEIGKLPYLNAICAETLRIYPVALTTFPRIPKLPIEIGDHKFGAGTCLHPCIYLIHHREELYPDSKQFKPERFLEKKFSSYEYCPFGGGNRSCIGIAFAQVEMKLVLATILRHWQLELVSKRPLKPIRHVFSIKPQGGVKMKVVEKSGFWTR